MWAIGIARVWEKDGMRKREWEGILRGKEVKGKGKRVEERKVLLLLFCGGYAVAAYKSAVVDR